MTAPPPPSPLPPPMTVDCRNADPDVLLTLEWLVANSLGAYASGTVMGCNTRRYHGLLIAATRPPVGRIASLAAVTEQLVVGAESQELGNHEFVGATAWRGLPHLVEFRNDIAPTFVFRVGKVELVKEVLLADAANVVGIRYTLRGPTLSTPSTSSGQAGSGQVATLRLRPLIALRDYHELRRADSSEMLVQRQQDHAVLVRDPARPAQTLHLAAAESQFLAQPDWWYSFHYRACAARGQEAGEDLYTPGVFDCQLADGESCQLTAALDEPPVIDFAAAERRRRERLVSLCSAVAGADDVTRRLAAAADTFIARRDLPDGRTSRTVLAGYPWFADWGRDAFIALPGLLLATGQFDAARQVFQTFAESIHDGIIPNQFDERTGRAHYNAVDGSLWFIIAADRYVSATGDADFARGLLVPTGRAILLAYRRGTQFDIHADVDGLLTAGSPKTQLTWMDAALGDEPVTSRHGKAVEVNALWHSAHALLAEHCARHEPEAAGAFSRQAQTIAAAFNRIFWNEQAGCCYDCVYPHGPDPAVRPNQIFAVSLPHSPLSTERQTAVVQCATQKLLTPYGLRTLAPDEPGYCGSYAGDVSERHRAYHQGTVWPFLMGPFIEAYLRVNSGSPLARAQAKHWLLPLEDHLGEAGLGTVSEIFDADPPHRPRGCIAQAWSVAELLRIREILRTQGPTMPKEPKA